MTLNNDIHEVTNHRTYKEWVWTTRLSPPAFWVKGLQTPASSVYSNDTLYEKCPQEMLLRQIKKQE